MKPDILDTIEELKSHLDNMDKDEMASAHIVIAHCLRALRFAKDAEGLSPTRRQSARSAYRMAAAFLGVEAA